MKLAKDLREFVELMNSRGVEYVLAGAYVMAFHARPRYTEHIDILVRPTPENAIRTEAVLAAFGIASLGLDAADFETPGRIVQLGLPPNRIDLLTDITGVTFDEAWAGREMGEPDGVPVPFLNRECLRRNKAAAGRATDLEDLRRLAE
jgi:hypothetical protein